MRLEQLYLHHVRIEKMQRVFFTGQVRPSRSHRDVYRHTKLSHRARHWLHATESITQISKRTLFPILSLSSLRMRALSPHVFIPFGAGIEQLVCRGRKRLERQKLGVCEFDTEAHGSPASPHALQCLIVRCVRLAVWCRPGPAMSARRQCASGHQLAFLAEIPLLLTDKYLRYIASIIACCVQLVESFSVVHSSRAKRAMP